MAGLWARARRGRAEGHCLRSGEGNFGPREVFWGAGLKYAESCNCGRGEQEGGLEGKL